MRDIITVRASALSDFLDCPARAEARHLKGMRTPRGAAAQLGTAVHASTAVYDKAALDGNPVSVDESAGAAVDSIRRPDDDVDWADDNVDQIEKIAVGLHTRYCEKIAPEREYAAVEVKCDRLEITDIGLALQGTTDRVRKVGEGYGISDLKTGKTAVRADGTVPVHGHAYQLGVYELLAERAAGLPITEAAEVIGLNVGVRPETQRVAAAPVSGAREVLIGEPDQPGILQVIADLIHSGNFFGNPRSQLCGAKWCPIFNACRYRK